MSEDLSKAAGAGVKVTIGGKEYEVMPLTMGDLAEFQGYVRGVRREDVRAIMADTADAAERLAALRRACSFAVEEGEMEAAMESFEGFRYILWRCLRKRQPELTLEGVGDLFTVADMKELLPVVQAISGLGDEENPTAAEPPATP